LALYLLAAAFVRRRLAELWPSIAPWAFAAIALNAFVLSYVPESLTESLSLTLILFGTGCWLGLVAGRGPVGRHVPIGSLLMGTAVMVRPANLFALGAWTVAVVLVGTSRRLPARTWVAVAFVLMAGAALPMVPQYVNNVRNYGQCTPLIVAP